MALVLTDNGLLIHDTMDYPDQFLKAGGTPFFYDTGEFSGDPIFDIEDTISRIENGVLVLEYDTELVDPALESWLYPIPQPFPPHFAMQLRGKAMLEGEELTGFGWFALYGLSEDWIWAAEQGYQTNARDFFGYFYERDPGVHTFVSEEAAHILNEEIQFRLAVDGSGMEVFSSSPKGDLGFLVPLPSVPPAEGPTWVHVHALDSFDRIEVYELWVDKGGSITVTGVPDGYTLRINEALEGDPASGGEASVLTGGLFSPYTKIEVMDGEEVVDSFEGEFFGGAVFSLEESWELCEVPNSEWGTCT